jgi:hypothetical protein
MNRRNLLKSLFVLPFVGMLKALPLRGPGQDVLKRAPKTAGITNTWLKDRASRTATGTAELYKMPSLRTIRDLLNNPQIQKDLHTAGYKVNWDAVNSLDDVLYTSAVPRSTDTLVH